MIRHFLVSLFLSPLVVSGLPGSTSSPILLASNCSDLSLEGCEKCLGQNGCYYVRMQEGSGLCLDEGEEPEGLDIRVYHNVTECGGSGEDPDVTVTPPTNTTSTTTTVTTSTTTTITTTTTDSTTTTTVTTTTVTPETTTTGNTTTTTVTPETTTTSGNTTTTVAPNSTTTAPPTSTTVLPVPDSGRGHFDGWSFFGGILLTLGLAAIGLVGFKYYRLRSGTGGNYNRF